MRVALIHDWLTGLRGGERVLDELVGIFPDAEIFTLVHRAGRTTERIDARPIHASPLSRLPGMATHYRKALPLFPWAIRRLDLEGFDLLVSSSHAFAKSVRRPRGVPHLCYCHTPLRYVWDQADAYLGRGLRRLAAGPAIAALRAFDRRHAGSESVSRFVANSNAVAKRIRRHYGRQASVIFPPVDVTRFRDAALAAPARAVGPEDFFLMVSAFVPYKSEALAMQAFGELGRRLVVVGEGPERARRMRVAPPNVSFTGRIDDAELAELYARCRALIHPQDEDFGMIAVEAQAAGRPVVALGRGGVLDSVDPARSDDADAVRDSTGVYFDAPRVESLVRAIERFEKLEPHFDASHIRRRAERFSPDRFRCALRREVDELLAESLS